MQTSHSAYGLAVKQREGTSSDGGTAGIFLSPVQPRRPILFDVCVAMSQVYCFAPNKTGFRWAPLFIISAAVNRGIIGAAKNLTLLQMSR